MKNIILTLGVITMVMFLGVSAVFGQNGKDMVRSQSGVVKSIKDADLVLEQEDAILGKTVEVAYVLDAKVKVANAESLQGILAGDKVEVSYVEKDGKKVVQTITVDISAQ